MVFLWHHGNVRSNEMNTTRTIQTSRERAAYELLSWLDTESVLTGIEPEERLHIARQWDAYCEDRLAAIREATGPHADRCACDLCEEYRALQAQ